MKTPELFSNILQGQKLMDEYLSERNTIITKIVSKTVAELRKKYPELRGKKLRGIVQLGLAHYQVTELIQKQKIKGLKIEGENKTSDFYPNGILRQAGIKYGTPESAAKTAMLTSIWPLYIEAKKEQQLEHDFNKIARLPQTTTNQIMEAIKNQTGPQRAQTIMQMAGL